MAALKSPREVFVSHLLNGLAEVRRDQAVTGIALDSRKVRPGDLFLACHGSRREGSNFIEDAVAAGAVAIAIESGPCQAPVVGKVPVIPVPGLRRQAGEIAARFYNHPAREMKIIGVTGTNGKTSVTFSVAQALGETGKTCGLVGTLGYGTFGRLKPGDTTTPDPVTLHSLLAQWRSQKIGYVAMEVSSHALDQGRVTGIGFHVAVFTNLTRDHLDYHVTMSRYAEAKRLLFVTGALKHAVINLDDVYGRELVSCTNADNKVGYAIIDETGHKPALGIPTVYGRPRFAGERKSIIEIESPWGRGQLEVRLVARFTVANLLASLAVLCLLDVPFSTALETLARGGGVPGRMECFGDGYVPLTIVDYAHTPDALKQVLSSLKPVCKGRLICVFGCGGERDRGKRPVMGKIAEDYANDIVLTNDNPRGEAPDAIIEDILAGITDHKRVRIETDRAIAIERTIRNANPQDIVVVAGKGHETYQEIAGRRYPFSDRELVRRLAEEMQ